MIIYDENGRIIDNPDMANGTVEQRVRVRTDADPIDNKTKFAWDDEDYETIAVYVPNDPSKSIKNEIVKLKHELADTDYIACKMMDSLAVCNSANDIQGVIESTKQTYSSVLIQREENRKRINELESQLTKL